MKQRSNKFNTGYIGLRRFDTNNTGILGVNRDYLQRGPTPYWSRPSDWLPMPEMIEGNDAVAALYGIYPGGSGATGVTASGNFVAFTLVGTTYVVDWGNGVTTRHTSGTTAQYIYYYEGISSGTLTTEGFRQVLAQAYPETTGRTFSQMFFGRRYAQAGVTLNSNYCSNMKSLKICSATTTTLDLTTPAFPIGSLVEFEYVGESGLTTGLAMFSQNFRCLKEVKGEKWTSKILNFQLMFAGCINLEKIFELNTSSGTNFTQTFQNCGKLRTVPLFNLSKATTVTSMFSGCLSLENIPSFDISRATNLGGMLAGCVRLQRAPFFNTSSATSMSGMFNGCASLQTIPLYNTSNVTNFNAMFQSCTTLYTIPLIDTSRGTDFSSMFQSCSNLEYIPNLDLRRGTNFSSMFNACTSLVSIPIINGQSGTNFNSMFFQCAALQYVPGITATLGTNFSLMFSGCSNLQTVNRLNTPSGTNFASMFNNCNAINVVPNMDVSLATTPASVAMFGFLPSLKVAALTGVTATISYSGSNLSSAALNDIFYGLGTGGTGKTITITNNWGASGCDKTIATGKGWSVTG